MIDSKMVLEWEYLVRARFMQLEYELQKETTASYFSSYGLQKASNYEEQAYYKDELVQHKWIAYSTLNAFSHHLNLNKEERI